MKELYELKEKLCDELKGYGKKDMSAGSLDVVDKLAHTIKNLDKIIEVYDQGESGFYDDGMINMPRGSYRNGSYARGRNVRRDNMGRYSGGGYSRHGLADKLRDLMEEAPDDRTRMEIQKLVEKMD